MRASELYARVEREPCQGMHKCHWCLAPCGDRYRHDDVPFLPFIKSSQLPKYPASPWCCPGCWHWRKGPITISFPGGGYIDRQHRKAHSWYIDSEWAYALDVECGNWLVKKLLKPKGPFVLSLVTNGERVPNLIHLMACNELSENTTAETAFHFTIDHADYTYTVYELEEGLKNGPAGKSAGVREILRLFKLEKKEPIVPAPVQVQANAPVGRPPADDTKHRTNEIKRMKRFLR